jgi:hypothetical protein
MASNRSVDMAKLLYEMSPEEFAEYLANTPPKPIERFELGYFLIGPGSEETYALVISVDAEGGAVLLPMPTKAPSFYAPPAHVELWRRPVTGGARLVSVSNRTTGLGLWRSYVPDMGSALLLWDELKQSAPHLRLTTHTPYAWERRWLVEAGYMELEGDQAGYIIPG